MTGTRRPSAPWLVLGLATLSSALTGPGQTIGVSVFIDHFVEDLALSRGEVSGAYLVGTLAGATLLPGIGGLVDRFGVRRAQMVIGLLFALALVNMSAVNGLIWLAIGFIGIRLLGQGSLSLVATVTVSLTFHQNRGTALGIFSTVAGGLMALVPVLLAVAIDGVGWRRAWLIAAVVIAATVTPIAWLGLRSVPAGTSAPEPEGPDPAPTPEGPPGATRAQALRNRSFWVLAAVNLTASMLVTALNFHQIDLLGDAGLSATAAAALFIPQVIGSTLAGLSIGYLSDRIPTRYLPPVGMALLLTAHILAAVVQPGATVFIYAVVLGAAGGAVRTTSAALLPAWYGTTHLGSIQGLLTLFSVASSAVGPVALALTESAAGSYRPALLILSVLPATMMLIAAFAVEAEPGASIRAQAS